MMRKATCFYGLVMVVLAGCASAGSQADLAKPIPAGEARIVVYRNDGIYESLDWVPVTLNGRQVGGAGPDSVFVRDVAPGPYRIDVIAQSLWPDTAKTVVAGAGETIYVKIATFRNPSSNRSTTDSAGPVFVPEVMEPAVARSEIGELPHTAAVH